MPRRRNSLTITTILKKVQRQGVSTYLLSILTERLYQISGQKHKQTTDDSLINVHELLRQGIRLHPFAMQKEPFATPDRRRSSGKPPGSRRSRTQTGQGEELNPSAQNDPLQNPTRANPPPGVSNNPPQEDLGLPGSNVESLSLP